MDTVRIYEIMCTLNDNMTDSETVFRHLDGYLQEIRNGEATEETVAILAQGTVFRNGGDWKFRLPAMRDVLGYTGETRLRFLEDEFSYDPMNPDYTVWEIGGEETPEIAAEFLAFLEGLRDE